MLKRLDPSLSGIRIGRARFMDGRKLAPVFHLGPLGIGRRVIGDLEVGESYTFRRMGSMFENHDYGKSVILRSTGKLEVSRWSADPLGNNAEPLREVVPGTVNKDPELKRFLYNTERGA